MSPKEKAEQLVGKFDGIGLQMRNEAIACALIAVDELVNDSSEKIYRSGRCYLSDREYWKEVQKEIQKL